MFQLIKFTVPFITMKLSGVIERAVDGSSEARLFRSTGISFQNGTH